MITLTEDEKRMVFQLESCLRYDAIQEIAVFCRYTCDHDKRNIAENLLKKLREHSENDYRELICDIQKKLSSALKSKDCWRDDRCGPAGVRRPETGRA